MNIQTLTLGPLATNCYLVRAEESRRAVIIDPLRTPNGCWPRWKSRD